jgi:hypothetical protein
VLLYKVRVVTLFYILHAEFGSQKKIIGTMVTRMDSHVYYYQRIITESKITFLNISVNKIYYVINTCVAPQNSYRVECFHTALV